MKKATLCLLCCVLCGTSVYAQSSVIFGHSGYDSGYQIIGTDDGGFMVGGQSEDTVTGNLQYWVVKGSRTGQIVWDSLYGGNDRDFLWSIQPSRDGGALLAGYSNQQFSGLESAVLFKIGAEGHTEKRIEVDYNRADHAHWFAERPQGGYFWAGHTDSEGDTTGEMILQKLDDKFTKVWEHTFHRNTGEHAHCGTLTADGGCVLLGHTVIANREHFWANRLDSNGEVVWSKVFQSSSTNNDSPYGIVATKSGGFAMFGGTSNAQGTTGSMWLLVVDSAGNKVIDKHFGTGDSFAFSGIEVSDSGFLLIGYTNTSTKGAYDAYVVRTDSKGSVKWQKRYGTTVNDLGYAALEHNHQFVLCGTTYATDNNQPDLWLLYIDSNGTPVSYDSSVKRFAFELDSNKLLYAAGMDNHIHGTVRNLTNDTLRLTFRRTDGFSKNSFEFHTDIGDVQSLSDTSSVTAVLLPKSSASFLEHIVVNRDVQDTGDLCVSVYASGDNAESQCISLKPLISAGIAETQDQAAAALSIYPNPLSKHSHLNIHWISDSPAPARFHIYSNDGRLIRTLTAGKDCNDLSWDGLNEDGIRARPGVYFVRLQRDGDALIEAVVVE